MFFWNSLAFSMIQRILAVWSLVPLPFLKPAWTSGSLQFTYCWSLACPFKPWDFIISLNGALVSWFMSQPKHIHVNLLNYFSTSFSRRAPTATFSWPHQRISSCSFILGWKAMHCKFPESLDTVPTRKDMDPWTQVCLHASVSGLK